MEYNSQKQQVLWYLQSHKKIDSFTCYMKLQIVDLQHAIYELRKEGYNIVDQWVKKTNSAGRKIQYKEYRLEENWRNGV